MTNLRVEEQKENDGGNDKIIFELLLKQLMRKKEGWECIPLFQASPHEEGNEHLASTDAMPSPSTSSS